MSIDNCSFYWPYAEGEIIERFETVACLGQNVTLSDGNTYYFGNVERHIDYTDNTTTMVYYFCSNTPHSHPDLPSCSRIVMFYE